MKIRHHIPLLSAMVFVQAAPAQDIVRSNNTDDLDQTTSWVGGTVPGVANVGVWDATVTSANSSALGSDQSWQGIRIASPGGNVAITGSDTLTIGSSGIEITGRSLTLAGPVAFGSDATLTLNTNNQGISFPGGGDLGGNTLTVISGHESR